MENFNFLDHHLCVSVGNPTGTDSVPADLSFVGDPERIIGALQQQMNKHSIIAGVICCAAFNYLRSLALPEPGMNEQQ